jgi:hypothetical protein
MRTLEALKNAPAANASSGGDETDWPPLSSWPDRVSLLDRAQERVAHGERLIARQEELIAELKNLGGGVSRSESLLATFEALQRLHLAHRDSLAGAWKNAGTAHFLASG